jgi:hypothetical protein
MKKWTILTAAFFLQAAVVVAEGSALTVEAAVGTGIENKTLIGESASFSADTPQVVGWSRITGAKEPTEIRHIWKCDGKEMSSVTLGVQSSSFRTHSRKNLFGKTGHWTFEVVDVEGNVLASKDFEVTATASQ